MRVDPQEIFHQVLREARSRGVTEVEAIISGESAALTRFANNSIHQNVAEQAVSLSVRPVIEGRTARATTNRLDRDSIANVVEQAIAITRLTEPDPDMPPLPEPAPAQKLARWYEETAVTTPAERAHEVAGAIRVVEDAGQVAAGIFSTGETLFALLNSRGISLEHRETLSRFSITSMTDDSSGWAKASACRRGEIHPLALAERAVHKAERSRAPLVMPPGRYTVVLEPAAVLDLVGQMFGDFSATAIRDGRSFLADRIGAKLFGENITIYDDVAHPGQSGPPFDGEGVPRQWLTLVDRGVVRDIAYSRAAALLAEAAPTGHGFPLPNEYGEAPGNIVIAGGETPLDEMIASTERGILVTRLWYIREVDPYEKIFTGMTRDGTFLIEDGLVVAGVRNFRFNEALPEMLSNVEALSQGARASGEEAPDMVVPAMKVRDFNFTEVTRF